MMNYHMQKAAAKEQDRMDRKDSEDRKRKGKDHAPGGGRSHHIDHYIPEEERVKFMASCDNAEAKAKQAALEVTQRIQSDNKGYGMLAKMGWSEGTGLGAKKDGMVNPVSAGEVKQNNLGVGQEKVGEVSEGDDIYAQYKKRMMLAYKYRPNPLGNPRKAYY